MSAQLTGNIRHRSARSWCGREKLVLEVEEIRTTFDFDGERKVCALWRDATTRDVTGAFVPPARMQKWADRA